MTIPQTPPIVMAELAAVRAELGRVDTKCSILTGLTGAAAAIVATQIRSTSPRPMAVTLGIAAALLASATLILLIGVLRPRLGSFGFRAYRSASDEDLAEMLGEEQAAVQQLRDVSQLVNTKFVRLRVAVDLTTAGVVCVAVGALVGAAA